MRVSVVVPTYRRPERLARCLTALIAQRFDPAGYEVLVADDAASSETRQQVETFARQSEVRISYLPVTDSHGPAAARNVGWRAARGNVIAFTDDDCIPDPDWLAKGIEPLELDEDLAAVTGRIVVPLPAEPSDYERDAAGLETAEFVTANCFCRRADLVELGGFDERFSAAWREDSDLHFRLLEAGRALLRTPEAVVIHPVRPAPWGVSLRQQRKVMFDALLFKKHPRLYRSRIRRRPLWNYYAIVLALIMAVAMAVRGAEGAALAAFCVWVLLTGWFLVRRLRGTSHTPRHIAEMAVTSAAIPVLSVFWRQYGAVKFRVLYL